MKNIAVSRADFEGIITSNFIYVDKTKYLYNIINNCEPYYFLSRPRRFGKSLTISTLKAIFEGKRDLFKGLYIENTDWSWEKHPVIQLDFKSIPRNSKEEMEQEISAVFYDNLKPLEQYLKTVFITGVSKFSKVSIFSTLNNLIELDTHVDYAAMLGYT